MILADKIIQLRKKAGWSQEELAEQMGVSRQAVCKWEGAQSIPDINRLIQLSHLFGVSTDYLLKDELEEAVVQNDTYSSEAEAEEDRNVHYVSMEEANAFLKVKEETTGKFAFGVFLCIISPIIMLLLAGASESNMLPITEDVAGGLGMLVLLLIVMPAVAIFIQCSMKTSPYEYLEKEHFETQYGVTGMVKERRENFRDTYMKYFISGVSLCVLASIPLFGVAMVSVNEFVEIAALCLTILIAAVGVVFILKASIPWKSLQKLLQEGDYSIAEKARKRKIKRVAGPISGIYWMVCTAIFLWVSLSQNNWYFAGVFWPVAGVLFGAVMFICKLFEEREK